MRKQVQIIDWLIKILLNYKYKKEPFMAWSWEIDKYTDINVITAEYYTNYHRFGTRTEFYKVESEPQESGE